MIRRLVILQIVLLMGLGLIYALPKAPPIKESALKLDMPSFVGLHWNRGEKVEPGEREQAVLAEDTQFLKHHYYRRIPDQPPSRAPLTDVLSAGVVMSGSDPSGSIHAMERCLGAQGFNITGSALLKVKLSTGHILPVRKLVCERYFDTIKRAVRSISYYWFVGHDSVTSEHVKRGTIDFWHRLSRGYDQRWAYATVTAYLDDPIVRRDNTGMTVDDLDRPIQQRALTESDADALVTEFLADFAPEVIKTSQVTQWCEK